MPAAWKTVRVFISSTFRDMQAERDWLVRFVFPRMREQLLPRRIHLVDVDLRWGVTSERDASEVCREIIAQCRPRFLCMLGGRYGTIPDGKEFSITADEIHFGVLDESRQKMYAIFCFRHGAVTEQMDKPAPGAIREQKGSEKARKLARLKRDIRAAKHHPFLYRPRWKSDERRLLELKAFGERVARDILTTIDDEFKPEPPVELDEFAEEDSAMESFIADRSENFVLGSREGVLNELLAHASTTGGKGYVCLTGSPGNGKSALLAHLIAHWPVYAPQGTLLVHHFVGASPGSTDVRRTLRRLCHQLQAGCPDIAAEIPDALEQLRAAFPEFLRQACASRRVVVVLDGLNQFDPASYLAGLHWLPVDLPANARFILSALDGPAIEELRCRPCPPHEIELEPLTEEDGEAIIRQFCQCYRKQLEPGQHAALLSKPDAGMPLYILAALEELRTLGTYEEITQRIIDLPPTALGLFAWILGRLEDDDGFRDASGRRVGSALVSRFGALMAASRYGLSQRELTDLLDPGDPQGNVASLLHLLRPYLMHRGELLDFYHGQFRDAVGKQYLGDEAKRVAAHTTLADYFDGRSRQFHARGFAELPYHLHAAGLRERLIAAIARREFLDRTCSALSREAMLGNLHFAADAACASRSVADVATVASAWGHVLEWGDGRTETRLEDLLQNGRWKDAVRVACAARPATRACKLLTTLGHHLLDSGQESEADELLRILLNSRLPVARAYLAEYLRLVERFLAGGCVDALDALSAADAKQAAARYLWHLVGTRNFSSGSAERLARVAESIADPFWRGICLLILTCRAVRRGFPMARTAARGLEQAIAAIPSGDQRTQLIETVSRCYGWLGHLGIRDDVLAGSTENRLSQLVSRPPSIVPPRSAARRAGEFAFLEKASQEGEVVDCCRVKDLLRRVIVSAIDSASDLAALRAAVSRSCLEETGGVLNRSSTESAEELLLRSILGKSQLIVPEAGDPDESWPLLARLSEDSRLALLGCLVKLGEGGRAAEALAVWESQAANGTALADVYRAASELRESEEVRRFLRDASARLKHRLRIEHGGAVAALLEALLHHGEQEESRYWMSFLIARIAPPMTIHLRGSTEPATGTAYLLLHEVLLQRDGAAALPQTRHEAIALAKSLHADHPRLAEAMGREYAVRELPVGQLADRLLAFAVDAAAWSEPDPEASLRRLADRLRIEVVNDDRERKRSWFFWLLVLSEDPTGDELAIWRKGVEAAQAVPLPHEALIIDSLGSHEPGLGPLDLVRQVAQLAGDFDAAGEGDLGGRLAGTALSGFRDPWQQASVFAYAAEALTRQGRSDAAQGFVIAARALASGAESFASRRVRIGELWRGGDAAALEGWPDAESFPEALRSVIRALLTADDPGRLVELTRFLPESAEVWRELLLAVGRVRLPAQQSACLVRALLSDLDQYYLPQDLKSDSHA